MIKDALTTLGIAKQIIGKYYIIDVTVDREYLVSGAKLMILTKAQKIASEIQAMLNPVEG